MNGDSRQAEIAPLNAVENEIVAGRSLKATRLQGICQLMILLDEELAKSLFDSPEAQ